MLNFPSAPTTGQIYSPGAGLPSYGWDGEKWATFSPIFVSDPVSSSNPVMDGAGSAGSATSYARGDHVHPTDSGVAPIANATFTGTLTAALVNATTVTASGKITSTAKGHRIGNLGGTYGSGGVARADANLMFYDAGEANWSGIGADPAGQVWFRTGTATANVLPPFYVGNDQIVRFRDSPTAPTPTAGDNSTKLATTAFVKGRTPGSTVPLAGGTVTGNVTIANVDLWVHNGGNYGVLYLTTGARYLQWDGTTYNFAGASVVGSQGRIYGTNDWASAPYNNARLAYVADYGHGWMASLAEPYGGSTITGGYGPTTSPESATWYRRYRQFQYYTTSWFAIGYA